MQQKLYTPLPKDCDFSDVDHVIIGSGIGGLTAATWLASAGKKVVVLERHYVPGGFTHSFKRKHGFNWDVGVHYVGNVAKGGSLKGLFDFLSDGQIEWESMGDIYDEVRIANDRYEIPAGKENLRAQLKKYFPDEAAAIDHYLKILEEANKRTAAFLFEKTFKPILQYTLGLLLRKRFRKFGSRSTYDVLSEITDNKRLLAVLCGQCGNYGLSPKYSSFAAHALVMGHFMEGGFFPKGGADQLALRSIEKLNALGGKVYIRSEVQEIITKGNKVTGIKVQDRIIPCKSVISNVGAHNTFEHLLDKKASKRCGYTANNVEASTGHLCLYVGLDKSSEELGLPKRNLWVYKHDDIDNIFDNIEPTTAAQDFAYISFPSAKDSNWEHKNPGTATIQAMTKGNFIDFKKYEDQPWMKREEAYQKIKAAFEKDMLEKLYELFPQIKGHVCITDVSTPLSTKHFSNYQHGEIYGLTHSPKRFTLPYLRSETKIKGLRLAGQDITIVGVAGAMTSGMLVAITILKFKVWRIFKKIKESQSQASS